MQHVLTLAFNTVAIIGFSYTIFAFYEFTGRRPLPLSAPVEPCTDTDDLEPDTSEVVSEPTDDQVDGDDFEDLEDLLGIGTVPSVTLRDCTIRQLKALGSLYGVHRFSKLRKDELTPAVWGAISA